jgi:hypothetical protein
MDFDEFAKSNSAKAVYKKAPYSKNRWQHEAIVYAERLAIKPNKAWFRFFKQYFDKYEPRFRSIMEKALNPNIKTKDKYFFWMFHNANRPKHTDKK